MNFVWLCKTKTRRKWIWIIVHVKTEDIYKDIVEDVETRLDTSNFEIERPVPKGKNKKVSGLIKDELGGQIMKEFVGLRAKT